MTKLEQIKAIIDSGHIAMAYEENEGIELYYEYNDDHFMIKHGKTIEESLKDDAEWVTCNNESIKDYKISIYQKPLRYPKPGDLVTILDSVKDGLGYNIRTDEYKKMIGGPFKVKGINPSICRLYTRDETNFYAFDYRHLAPYFGEDEKYITVEYEGRRIRAKIV